MDTNIIVQDNRNDIAEFSVIRSKIHEIRDQKVMLDFELAALYQVETKNLKRAVRYNIERFPDDFMFELTQDEVNSLRCKNCTLKTGSRGQHTKYLPFAFTEQGVAQLSSVLNSPYAIKLNINIIRAFVVLRKYSLGYNELKQELKNFITEMNTELKEIYKILDELTTHKKELEKPRNPIGFRTIKN